ICLPLLRAKLGENYRQTSAAFIWATIARMYAARKTGLKKEMFGYVPGGYARILESFGELLAKHGVTVKLNSAIHEIATTAHGTMVETKDGSCEEFDEVVVTAPGSVAARMAPELPEKEK